MEAKKLESIPCISEFLELDNELDRFDYAADLALLSPELAEGECTEENRVLSCDSGLYYRMTARNGHVDLVVQSASLLVKGLGVMLAGVLAAYPAEEFATQTAGLADLLYQRGVIALERKKGLAELEVYVTDFAARCQ